MHNRLPAPQKVELRAAMATPARFGSSDRAAEELALDFGRWRHIKRQCSYDRFRDVFRVVIFDSLTSHSNILEGRLEDGRLTATNLDTGTTWEAKGQTYHMRERVYEVKPDRFKVDQELSTDGGKTWIAFARFDYRRQIEHPQP